VKKVVVFFFALLSVCLLASGGFLIYVYHSTVQTADEVYEAIERESSEKREVEFDMGERDPISILLLGIGDHPDDTGRSDSMMVLTLNPEEESMYMFNIPRDTRTEIIGLDREDKINHAYAFGGNEMAVNTVEQFLNIPIDYYVSIGMKGFREMIDVFGGVTVHNEFAFELSGEYYPEGEIHLDGKRALLYSRMRKSDPRGDLGRNARQQQVLNALIEEGATFSSFTRIHSILDVIGGHLRTDLKLDEMKLLFDHYRDARNNMERLEIKGDDLYIDGIYYYNVPEEERQRISHTVRQHLELESGDEERHEINVSGENDGT
jgi:polyisoprenyl-teichoic acid--peptidoglycan teichoic acid transferase